MNPSTEPTRKRRADALRNVETIIEAATHRLARDPEASMSDIAAEAGLGRVTLYGHFKTRTELVEAVARRVLAAADRALGEVDLSGTATDALSRLIEATWEVTVRSGRVIVAAEKALPAPTLREMHSGSLEARVRNVIAHGQESGEFRQDLPTDWLIAIFHAVVHAAANEIGAGRLEPARAAEVITASLLGACGVADARATTEET